MRPNPLCQFHDFNINLGQLGGGQVKGRKSNLLHEPVFGEPSVSRGRVSFAVFFIFPRGNSSDKKLALKDIKLSQFVDYALSVQAHPFAV